MEIRRDGLSGLTVDPNELVFAGINAAAGRKRPLGEVGVVVGEVHAIEADHVGAAIVEFDPGVVLAEIICDAIDVDGLDFV